MRLSHNLALGDKISLKIENLGIHGEGVARPANFPVIFVPWALPGELVEVQITELKENYAVAKILEIKEISIHRQSPPLCPVFSQCGGCQIMNLSYAEQLRVKEARVLNDLQHIGRIHQPPMDPIVPSPEIHHYRNKIQLPIQAGKMGFYAPGSHQLIPIEKCYLHQEVGDEVFQRIRTSLEKHPELDTGLWRHLFLRTSRFEKKVLACFITRTAPSAQLRQWAKQLIKEIPELKGIWHNQNATSGNTILGQEVPSVLLAGVGILEEHLAHLHFKISVSSFFQVNPLQAEQLYLQALELCQLSADDIFLDAYCGVGTLGLLAAKKVKKVIGIEIIAEAVKDARENAARNNIHNAEFIVGATEKFPELIAQSDVLLLNPPRKGVDKKFLQAILANPPKRLLYISCNPATLARDLKILIEGGAKLQRVRPFDMFPQTIHVESIALVEFF